MRSICPLYESFRSISAGRICEPPEDEEIPLEEDTSHLFFNKLGYELTTDDKRLWRYEV